MRRRGFLATLLLPFLPTLQLPWEEEWVPCGVRVEVIHELPPISPQVLSPVALVGNDSGGVDIKRFDSLEELTAVFGDIL